MHVLKLFLYVLSSSCLLLIINQRLVHLLVMFFAIRKVFQRFFRGFESKVVEMFSTLRAEQNMVERGKLLIWV